MAKAAEQGKALDDTDEVQADEVDLFIEQGGISSECQLVTISNKEAADDNE